MRLINILKVFVLLFILAGCAGSNSPKYINSTTQNSATVEGTLGNLFKILFSDSANVRITRIDGKEVRSLANSFKVTPGEHVITLYANTATTQAVKNVAINVKANNRYKFIAKTDNNSYKFYLYNITNPKSKKLIKTITAKVDYIY